MIQDDPLPFGAEHAFLEDLSTVAALREAISLGLIDARAGEGAAPDLPPRAERLLMSMLRHGGVVTGAGDLAPDFAQVWTHRRFVLRAKLDFLHRAALDIGADLHWLLFDLPRFQQSSRAFGFFRYDKALDISDAALKATRPWVDYVTALSLTEVPHLVPMIDLGPARRVLEIGGNTGVLSEALLGRAPGLSAAVLDLPAVCALGRARMADSPVANRLKFIAGDARTDPWPGPVDAILFKSVLHDWPEAETRALLARAVDRLSPGGRIVIVERAPMEEGDACYPLWMLANLVFAPFYRSAETYAGFLREMGLEIERLQGVTLDLPFYILTARRSRKG